MKKVENKIMLITYSDSLGKNLSELKEILLQSKKYIFLHKKRPTNT